MKELKNLEAIRELLASHPIYTYDYSDGLYINKEATNIQVYSIDLEDEPFAAYISGYIITYASEEVLFEIPRDTNRYLILGILDEAGYPHCCLLGQPKQMFNPQLN